MTRTPTELNTLIRLAVPVVITQFAFNAVPLIVNAVTGRIGVTEYAATAYATAMYFLVFMLLEGTMFAVTPRAAQAAGQHNPAAARRASNAGLWLALLLSLVSVPLLLLASTFIPGNATDGTQGALARAVLQIMALGILPALMFTGLRGEYEAGGQARTVTLIAAVGVIVALLLTPALTFGQTFVLGGLRVDVPALGLKGAAAAGVVTNTVTALLLLLGRPQLSRELQLAATTNVRQEVAALFRLGWPIGLTLGAESGMFTITVLLMSTFGSAALAAHNAAFQVITSLFMVPLGLSTAVAVRTGQEYGAGRPDRVRHAGLVAFALSAGVMLIFAALGLTVPRTLLGVYVDTHNPSTQPIIAQAVTFLGLAALFQVMDGLQVTANAALRGIQETRWSLWSSVASYWVVGLGLGVTLAFGLHLGPNGLWYGLIAGLSTSAALLVSRFLRRTRQLAEQPVAAPAAHVLRLPETPYMASRQAIGRARRPAPHMPLTITTGWRNAESQKGHGGSHDHRQPHRPEPAVHHAHAATLPSSTETNSETAVPDGTAAHHD